MPLSDSQLDDLKTNSYDMNSYVSSHDLNITEKVEKSEQIKVHSKGILMLCYLLSFTVSFILYGIFPGIQSYSTLPYGSQVYSYSVNLSNYKHNKYTSLYNIRIYQNEYLLQITCQITVLIYLLEDKKPLMH